MKVYRIVVGESEEDVVDFWLISSSSISKALAKAESNLRKKKDWPKAWEVVSVTLTGELED